MIATSIFGGLLIGESQARQIQKKRQGCCFDTQITHKFTSVSRSAHGIHSFPADIDLFGEVVFVINLV